MITCMPTIINALQNYVSIIIISAMRAGSKRPKFQEQFEDSEANHSEVNQGMPQRGEAAGEPIQLIRIRENGKVEVVEQALNIIAQYNMPVGFVSLVGKMRTGKSCLLNRLLQLTGKGFQVDPSVSSCTQGIWMWSQPLFNAAHNNYVFFLDTEGTDSLEKDVENDTKIFTLALLISSYFIYNSVGSIDERSLSQLEMVTALSKTIKTDGKLSERDNQESLHRYMPKFLWVLRDFTLKIEDERGRKISPTQYLQNCLNNPSYGEHSSEDSRKIKKSICNFFKDRECVTLVRPIGDQSQLQKMNNIPDHYLRREFVEGVNNLRDLVLRNAGPKTYDGQIITGPAITSMIQSYVEAFNSDSVPNIRSAWQQISEDEGAAAFNRALQKYQQIFREEFPDDSPKGEQIYKIVNRLRDETMKQFEASSFGNVNEDYLKKLKNLIKQKEENVIQINNNVNELRNHQILKKHAQKFRTKLESGKYVGKKQELSSDYNEVLRNYNAQARGEKKSDIITDFINSMTPIILALDKDNSEETNHANERRLKEQQQRKDRINQQQLDSLRNQIKILQQQQTKNPKTGGAAKADPRKNPKEGSTGCCSGDKCEIM